VSSGATPTIRRHPHVFIDIIDIADYIARDSLDAALRFPDQVDATLRGLAEMPGKGPRCGFAVPNLTEVRFYS
jgi:plasmid stabilization system protein ParE